MPLIIMCGFPSSGKTMAGNIIKKYMEEEMKKSVFFINENELLDREKNDIFADSNKEKPIRSALRGHVERNLSRESVIILDGLNYIKSFRYELFCLCKAEKTLHCIVQCCYPKETCWKWNDTRPDNERYTREIFDSLMMRFEEPDSRNRWDSPLFTVTIETELDLVGIYESLFERSAKPPNQSTLPTPLSSANFMQDLDQVTQSIITEVLEQQNISVVGDSLKISGTDEKVLFLKNWTMAELRRLKRQFINYQKLHPVENLTKLKTMYVQFINNSISNR